MAGCVTTASFSRSVFFMNFYVCIFVTRRELLAYGDIWWSVFMVYCAVLCWCVWWESFCVDVDVMWWAPRLNAPAGVLCSVSQSAVRGGWQTVMMPGAAVSGGGGEWEADGGGGGEGVLGGKSSTKHQHIVNIRHELGSHCDIGLLSIHTVHTSHTQRATDSSRSWDWLISLSLSFIIARAQNTCSYHWNH